MKERQTDRQTKTERGGRVREREKREREREREREILTPSSVADDVFLSDAVVCWLVP